MPLAGRWEAVITKSLAHLRQARCSSPRRGIFEMLQARFGLLCCSSFQTVAQEKILPKITPGCGAEPTLSGGPWGGRCYTHGSSGMGRTEGTGGTGNALSHGRSPKQKEPGETARAGCSQGFGTLIVGSRHRGAMGGSP